MNNLKVMDLFCGTGGFTKGFENTGKFDVVFGIDVLDVAAKTFALNHPEAVALSGDIRNVRLGDVSEATGLKRGEVDCIVGGPPCQGFSSIRPFRSSGDDDPRNSLFENFAAYVNYFRPPVFVMENVVGLATHGGGQTICLIQETFEMLGYETDWRILNAAHFGVPQKRERLVMIGVEKGIKPVFPKPTHTGEFKTVGVREKGRQLLPNSDPNLFGDDKSLGPAISVNDAIGDLPPLRAGESASSYIDAPMNAYQSARRQNSTSIDWHIATDHSPKMLEIIKHSGPNIHSIPEHLITSGFSSSYSRLDADEPSVTLTVNFVHPASNKCIHPYQDRALTIREGARIQSFDDQYKFSGTRTQVVKQIGNAVPPVLGQRIAETVFDLLS